ncbi:MAG TPA: reverse transcriptase domain-containing protein, partial [Puia sp.]|nr:reverse transcriptase domain-containing protein [Puia sp.]
NRKFCVRIKDSFSTERNVTSGVPQGSILSPLLFIVYIADLPEFCKTEGVEIGLFADDLKAYHIDNPSPDFHLSLHNFIVKLADYCVINGLEIAIDKCFTLHIGNKNPNHTYSLSQTNIPNIPKGESVRDLGVYFTADLKWKSHINTIVTKARRIAFTLLRSLRSNDYQFLVNTFKTYVMPILEFACQVFNPYYAKDIKEIEKVQHEFINRVYFRCRKNQNLNGFTNTPPYAELLATFGLESLELRRLKFCLKMFHQYLHGQIPIKTDAFTFLPTKTRGEKYKISIQPATNDVRFNSFFIRYARIYNQLDANLKNTNPFEFSKQLNCTDLSKFLQTTYE